MNNNQTIFLRNKLKNDFKTEFYHQTKIGVSSEDIYDRIGISRQTVWRMFQKDSNPLFLNVVSVCKFIGKPIDNYVININK